MLRHSNSYFYTLTVDAPKPIPRLLGRGISSDKPIEGVSETLLVFDYLFAKQFNFKMEKSIEYASVLINSMNDIYAASSDPKLKFVLVGVYLLNVRRIYFIN